MIDEVDLIHLGNMQQLKFLSLERTTMKTLFAAIILNLLPNLHSLNISSCPGITNDALMFIQDLKKLHCLNIMYCSQINNFGMDFILTMKNLHQLNIKGLKNLTAKKLLSLIKLVKNNIQLDSHQFRLVWKLL